MFVCGLHLHPPNFLFPPCQLSLPPSLRLRAFTTGSNHGAIAVLLSTSEVLEVQEQALSRDTKVVSFCVEVRCQATPTSRVARCWEWSD